METLPREASAFWFTWNKTEESHSYRRAYLKRVCRLRFSFFANDFDLRSRAASHPLGAGAPRGRGTSRDGRLALRDLRLVGESRFTAQS
jgi:hypothetical protein